MAVLGVILAPAEGNDYSGRIIKRPRVLIMLLVLKLLLLRSTYYALRKAAL